jgi:hypothetical protein
LTTFRVGALLAVLFAAAALYAVLEELAFERKFRRHGLIDGRELDR